MRAWMTSLACLTALLPAAAPAGGQDYAGFFASRVAEYRPGPGNFLHPDPLVALDGPRGKGPTAQQVADVVTLGVQGTLTLAFDGDGRGRVIANGPGADFIIFENSFQVMDTDWVFAELMRVQVSSDGVHFAEFPTWCGLTEELWEGDPLDATLVRGFAGVRPVIANVTDANRPSPFDVARAGGDAFDLAGILHLSEVAGGLVDPNRIRFIRLVDVLGDGSESDSAGNPIYDPTGGFYVGPPITWIETSADVDAVAVLHGLIDPDGPAGPIPGDADGDGIVGSRDYVILKANYGLGPDALWEQGDFSGDGWVNRADLLILKEHFGYVGSGSSAPVPVPAPQAAMLLAAGAAGLLRRRRRRGVTKSSPAWRRLAGGYRTYGSYRTYASAPGFTLIEMLSVVGIIGLLAGMTMPSLLASWSLTRRAVCQANIRLLQLGNQVYARNHDDFYAPGAPHMFAAPGLREDPDMNLIRWYGVRKSLEAPFSREGGPLSAYLTGQLVKGCPSFTGYLRGFEAGCGGFGYNNSFVGQFVRRTPAGYRPASDSWHLTGNHMTDFDHPEETVAFTDSALAGRDGPIEYSFCEPPTWPLFPRSRVQPSIQFRHLGTANIVWLDGHVGTDRMSFSLDKKAKNPYGTRPEEFHIGWFGPKNNSFFDCR